MPTTDQDLSISSEQLWLSRASTLARRTNIAWWLSAFSPVFLLTALVFSAALIVVRRIEADPIIIWVSFSIVLLASALGAQLRSRRHFVSAKDVLCRLDYYLRLHGRLSSSAHGIGAWPRSPTNTSSDGLIWRWDKILLPIFSAVLLLAVSAFVPVAVDELRGSQKIEPPLSVTQVEELLEELKEQAIVKKDVLETVKEQVEELKSQPESKWYDQHSLEAADNLREKTEKGLEALLGALEQSDSVLAQIENQNGLSPSELKGLHSKLEQALNELKLGTMPLSEELLAPLSEMAEKGVPLIKSTELGGTKRALKGSAAELRKLLRKEGTQGTLSEQEGELGSQSDSDNSGECDGGGSGEHGGMCTSEKAGKKNGKGGAAAGGKEKKGAGDAGALSAKEGQGQEDGPPGISRGPGEAPLNLREKAPQATSNRTEADVQGQVDSKDVGELLGLGVKEPEVEIRGDGVVAAGDVSDTGSGGESALNGEFTPAEREVLKRYFR